MASFCADFLYLKSKNIIDKDGRPVDMSSFDDKIIGLYFSAHWCGPCRGFTPKLAEKYKELIAEKNFEIIFISSDEDEGQALEYYAEMPWKMLAFSDREAERELSSRFQVKGIPTLVLIDAVGTITTNGREAVMTVPYEDYRNFEAVKKAAEEKAARELEEVRLSFKPSTYFADMVQDKEGNIIPASYLTGKIVGIYFSAHWCPPCRGFTPILAEKYREITAEDKPFEIIFVSSDRDEESATEYYSSMPWKMLSFKQRDKKKTLSELFDVSGIPTLVLVDDDGTITTNGREALMSVPFDDLRLFEERKRIEKERLDKIIEGFPDTIIHECHEHPLVKMPKVYGGSYGCDVCGEGGEGWVYHCDQCGFDAHPACVVKDQKGCIPE